MLLHSVARSQQLPTTPNYLQARENYLVAKARYERQEEALRLLLGAADTGASLERAMLEARTNGLHGEAIMKLSTLGTALDRASDTLDLATELQRRKIAAQQAELHKDIASMDE